MNLWVELVKIGMVIGVGWAILSTTVENQSQVIRALTDQIQLLDARLRDVERAVAVSSALIEKMPPGHFLSEAED